MLVAARQRAAMQTKTVAQRPSAEERTALEPEEHLRQAGFRALAVRHPRVERQAPEADSVQAALTPLVVQ